MDRKIQVYACDSAGLVHAGPRAFTDGVSLADECWAIEQMWRRWRDRYISDSTPRAWPKKFKHTRTYSAPIDDRRNATMYCLVDLETGVRIAEIPVEE